MAVGAGSPRWARADSVAADFPPAAASDRALTSYRLAARAALERERDPCLYLLLAIAASEERRCDKAEEALQAALLDLREEALRGCPRTLTLEEGDRFAAGNERQRGEARRLLEAHAGDLAASEEAVLSAAGLPASLRRAALEEAARTGRR